MTWGPIREPLHQMLCVYYGQPLALQTCELGVIFSNEYVMLNKMQNYLKAVSKVYVIRQKITPNQIMIK